MYFWAIWHGIHPYIGKCTVADNICIYIYLFFHLYIITINRNTYTKFNISQTYNLNPKLSQTLINTTLFHIAKPKFGTSRKET